MIPPPLLLDSPRLQHSPLELRSLMNRFGKMSVPARNGSEQIEFISIKILMRHGCAKQTNRDIFPTCASIFHRSFRLSRYSMAARSLAVMIPSFSDARAFHIRTLPSSEPDNTNRASAENIDDDTLRGPANQCFGYLRGNRLNAPLHPLRMIYLRPSSLSFFPNPHRPIPSTTNKLKPRRTPITAHNSCDMCFVYLRRHCEIANVKCI